MLKIDGVKPINSDTIAIGIDLTRGKPSIHNQYYIGTCLLGHKDASVILVSVTNSIHSIQGASVIIHSIPINDPNILFIRPFLYGQPYRYSYMLKVIDLRKLLSIKEIKVSWIIWRVGLHKLHVQLFVNNEKLNINDLELLVEIPSFYSKNRW